MACAVCEQGYHLADEQCIQGGSILCLSSIGLFYHQCQKVVNRQKCSSLAIPDQQTDFYYKQAPNYCLSKQAEDDTIYWFFPSLGGSCLGLAALTTRTVQVAIEGLSLQSVLLTMQVVAEGLTGSQPSISLTFGSFPMEVDLPASEKANLCGQE